jgi:hypothetical protein
MPLPTLAFGATIASGSTASSGIDLGYGWNHIGVMIPSMASGTDVYFKVSDSLDGTYRRVYHHPTISNSNPAAMFVNSAVTNCYVHLEFVNAQYVKVELSTAMTATSAQFKIICSE